ncbi:SusC/RagA family TonB-linked outer membrane protein [Chitinophaga sp. 22321]|uniref:SusC/RagA family TonB-linked outer membrane protein n=1 Tax=Chitinophaga hostae TaxID=2831022 RepID=A0ABS5JAG0_9BACT|nr:SusC/RagA family TonB-linked outer membrane protein [Chitinophaga hostae]MBS0032050.1 SusC/RagA family TonB-linked outer membrane protein [Chitinophaga hostae]
MSKNFKIRSIAGRSFLVMMLLRFCLYASAQGYSDDRVTLLAGNVSLGSIMKKIEKQTHRRFNYSENELNTNEKVNVSYNEAPLNQVLGQLFNTRGITWKYIDNGIYLRKETNEAKKEPQPAKGTSPKDSSAFPLISGKITDEEGNPLPGATIMIKGTAVGTSADAGGRFVLANIPHNAALRFTYTSFESREIVPGDRRSLSVTLKRKIGTLDETVVIGYGTTTKRFNTGAVSSVQANVIAMQPVTDPMMALEGRVPGLYINQVSGIPGANIQVLLRGKNSMANGNNPLYIIDGVPFPATSMTPEALGPTNATGNLVNGGGTSPFNGLNPGDIERIDVLKDADATAIYGSRGANGVILITTKKGRAGKTTFDLNISTGGGKVTNMVSLLNTPQYLEMRHEAFKNDNRNPGKNDYDINGKWDTTRYTDWQKVLIGGTARLTNIQAVVAGGNANTQFSIRGGYSNQTTVFPGDYSDRKASLLFSFAHSSADEKFRTSFSANYVNDKNKMPVYDFTGNILLAPDAPAVYDSLGQLNWENNTFVNPLGPTKANSVATSDNLISNLTLSYELLPGLFAKASFGYNYYATNQAAIQPLSMNAPMYIDYTFLRSNTYGNSNLKSWLAEPQINYIKKMGNGKLDILLGATFQQNTQTSSAYQASDFTSDALITNIMAAKSLLLLEDRYTQYKYNALFGRINYNWKEKYLVNLTARRDGSSRFGPGKQFGNFGAMGIGWIFSEENWIKDHFNLLSFGKIRASYGTTGNDQIPDYQYLSTYSSYVFPYQGLPSISPTRLFNPDYGWERVNKLEFGLETGFLNNRILFNADYYRNRSGNQLVAYPLPTTTGFLSVQYNRPAIVQNTGIELELTTVNIKTEKFNWSTSANISIPHNKLIKYPDIDSSSYGSKYKIGESIYINPYFKYTGVNPETGLYTVLDANNDGTMNDYIISREITQKYYGGLQNTFNLKGFELNVFVQFVNQTGADFLSRIGKVMGGNNRNAPIEAMNRWQQKGDITDIQRFSTGNSKTNAAAGWRNNSDISITDASFIRLKNIVLSYSLPSQWLKKVHLQNARIYAQGQNLFTITNYKGLDPETKNGLVLPPIRMIVGGIQLGL